jgi:hypothetical protein
MATKGIYLYGIVPNLYGAEMLKSVEDKGIYAIPYQQVSAIVSDRKSSQLDYSDRESLGYLLVNHQKTIEELTGKGLTKLIPMRLGTILGSKEQVIKILATGYDLINETLKKIEHLTEIDIAVTWADFSGTIREIALHPDIVAMKEDIINKPETHMKIDQVKIGMMVQEKLKEKNSKIELRILDSLSPICLDIKTHEVMNDEMITNSAFLVNRNKMEKFEQVIGKLDEEYNGLLNFKLVGPLPCYSFYTVEFKELNAAQVEQSRKMLGLTEETTESEMKKAYLDKARIFHPDKQAEDGDVENFNRIKKAFNTLQDYSLAARQLSKNEIIPLSIEKVSENLILVKIKE